MKALAAFVTVTALGVSGLHAETAATSPVMLVVPGVMAQTPTGAGDPDTIMCRAPQYIAGSGEIGPQLCLHNSEWWKLAANGKDVAADGKTLIDRPTVIDPKGEGDPEAVTCRKPQALVTSERLDGHFVGHPGPEVCRTNHFWADVIKNDQMVDARGRVVTRRSGSFGELSGLEGTVSFPGADSGMASQSSATP